ncbi:hypothetical protein RRG08_062132 [Elysia crispata]|uniref:Uncharacterized protein n=1 Tax=Elysia crispata TaxID=231223 RepID=A0AAE1DSZ5_9GAST|nr:hypothetical protein RRG08_062132 [Elysia crispata]
MHELLDVASSKCDDDPGITSLDVVSSNCDDDAGFTFLDMVSSKCDDDAGITFLDVVSSKCDDDLCISSRGQFQMLMVLTIMKMIELALNCLK